MTPSPNTQAVLLLTAHFTKADTGGAKPLTPREYGRFAEWLKNQGAEPAHLLNGYYEGLLSAWRDKSVTEERLASLLSRGSALALSMDKWLGAGLWVMSRSDDDYPRRLKQHLRQDAPAVLFGCGSRALLSRGGVAVVGSRKASAEDLSYARRLGAAASAAGLSVVSGGARGIDESAMEGALESEGTAVGVLAESLLRACLSARWRTFLLDQSLALVSPFNPEARFNPGNAMARNKYIYCLADAALAVHSGKKGGTWEGAREALRRAWVPVWVKKTADREAGNAELIKAGAREAPSEIDDLDVGALLVPTDTPLSSGAPSQAPLAPQGRDGVEKTVDEQERNDSGQSPSDAPGEKGWQGDAAAPGTESPDGARSDSASLENLSFYELFVIRSQALCTGQPRSADELAAAFDLTKSQVNAWLKRAVAEGALRRQSTRPARYEVEDHRQGDLALKEPTC